MKEFSISVKTTGYEYYIVHAETFEEAVEEIKNGDAFLASSENEWNSQFYLDDESEFYLDDEEEI